MNTLEVAEHLPAALPWAIIFELGTIRALAEDAPVRRMFLLGEGTDLDVCSHVALTPAGRVLAVRTAGEDDQLRFEDGRECPPVEPGMSLATKLTALPDRARLRDATCVGVAQARPRGWDRLRPDATNLLAVHVDADTGWGTACAILPRRPRTQPSGLLRSVGVEYLGDEPLGDHVLAHLRIHLPTHIEAAALGGFARGDNCTQLFIDDGEVTAPVAEGLSRAGRDRVLAGRDRTVGALNAIVRRSLDQALPMVCVPPPPAQPYPYGDLAPLGPALRALSTAPDDDAQATAAALRAKLLRSSAGGLWSFHRGGLPTATDSSLVVMGLDGSDRDASLEAVEWFREPDGGFLPQRSSSVRAPGHMLRHPAVEHWDRPDFPTTALLTWTALESGRNEPAGLDYLLRKFDQRDGLFMANPYLSDWFLSGALGSATPASGAVQERTENLLDQVLASRNDDHTFGRFDLAASTSLAVLTLANLGYRGRAMRLSQLRLLELLDQDGTAPEAALFYQSLRLPREVRAGGVVRRLLADSHGRVVTIGDDSYEVSTFIDQNRVITTALAALALSQICTSSTHDTHRHGVALPGSPSAERYTASTPYSFVAQFALPGSLAVPALA